MRTYEFRGANGHVCCSSDDVRNLCDSCKAKAAALRATTTGAVTAASATLRSSGERKTEEEWLREIAIKVGDGFLPTTAKTPRQPQTTDDPAYHPYGEPPDGFALAVRRESKR